MSERRLVVHCRNTQFDVYIGRPTIFGNPFGLATEDERDFVCEQYAQCLRDRCADDYHFLTEVQKLRGQVLGCWCAPRRCHGDEIVKFLDEMLVD